LKKQAENQTLSAMHKKHADLQKPSLGTFARNEVALLGTTCDAIALWAQALGKALAPARVVYADANHHPAESSEFLARWTDEQHAIRLDLHAGSAQIDRHVALSQADLVIVNGNHFEASHQIIFCDPDKEASLRKRASQLTHVVAFITTNRCRSVPEYLKEILPQWSRIPVLNDQNIGDLLDLIKKMLLAPPPLKALIMAGGKSVRMGKDKTHINYHGKPQFAHIYTLCEELGLEPHVSCRPDQAAYFQENGFRIIADRMIDMGPAGGIASAFMTAPDNAWLVLASDIPLLDRETVNELITSRDSFSTATAFQSPFDQFPEPLLAIWEPKAYPRMLSFIGLGYSCPRKVLIQTQAKVIQAKSPEKLENVNTPDELNDVMQLLNKP
jgi:molybdopterin-guanine dinucleotide biosynthesis protein A